MRTTFFKALLLIVFAVCGSLSARAIDTAPIDKYELLQASLEALGVTYSVDEQSQVERRKGERRKGSGERG